MPGFEGYTYRKALLSGTPSWPSEVSYAYLDVAPEGGSQKGVVLLIHGYPETSYQFRHVIPLFAKRGYRVIAPDYRGAGNSSKPRDGYTKATIADDIHELLTKHLGIAEKISVVGHDIGGMVAHAYAARHSDSVSTVSWGECPLPGTNAYDEFLLNLGVWHFHLHWTADLPEQLTQGHEAQYLKHFYDRLSATPGAIGQKDVEYYAHLFAQPGGMRAGFDLYRAFHQDAIDNRELLKKNGKCQVPCQTLNGSESFLANIAKKQAEEMYEHVVLSSQVQGSGHWCAEENPEHFVELVLEHVSRRA